MPFHSFVNVMKLTKLLNKKKLLQNWLHIQVGQKKPELPSVNNVSLQVFVDVQYISFQEWINVAMVKVMG